MKDVTFFGMDEACELAIKKFGLIAHCWNWDRPGSDPPRPEHKCEIGTGGAGREHVVYGHGDNWVEAARMAGLFE